MSQVNDEQPPRQKGEGVAVYCWNCKHWNRVWPQSNVAECMAAKRWSGSSVYTTDLQTCSQAEAKAS